MCLVYFLFLVSLKSVDLLCCRNFFPILQLLFSGINAFSLSNEEDIEFDLSGELSPEAYGIIGKIKCKLCKGAMKIVEKEVNKDTAKVNFILEIIKSFDWQLNIPWNCSQNEIKKALAKACSIIPEKNLRRKCREAIERKGDEIVDKIVGNITAANICKVLGFCWTWIV